MKEPSTFYEETMRTEAGSRVDKLIADPAAYRFIGEQDGPSERKFNDAVVPILKRYDTVDFAYLARIQYSDQVDWSVALCLRCSTDREIGTIVASVSDVFSKMFAENLDIMFVDHDVWQTLRLVCKPFYIRSGAAPAPRTRTV